MDGRTDDMQSHNCGLHIASRGKNEYSDLAALFRFGVCGLHSVILEVDFHCLGHVKNLAILID